MHSHANLKFGRGTSRPAFSMIELIITIGIIVLIMSLVVAMLGKANKTAQRTRQSADLQSITQALEAYRADQRDYPRLPPGTQTGDPTFVSGAELLCWALLAPGPAVADGTHPVSDGSDGMGFRTRGTKGQVYGPYLTPGKFRLMNMNSTKSSAPLPTDDDSAMVILDYWDHPIYYCPATANADPTVSYVNTYPGNGPRPMYDMIYFKEPGTFTTSQYQEQKASLGAQDLMAVSTVQEMLGDLNHNGMVDTQDNQHPDSQQNLPFLLWSAGPNGLFGYDKNMQGVLVSPHTSDDVTNFTVYFPSP